MKKKIFVIFLAITVVAAFSMTGCGNKTKLPKSRDKNANVLLIKDSAWDGVDLYQLSSWNDMQTLIADSPLNTDPKTHKAIPGIASKSKWSKDGLTWTLTFPKGMYYSTGEQLEPEDFIASVKYGMKVSPYASSYKNIKSMEVSGRDVIVHFKYFQADTEFNFETCFTGVIDKDEIDSMSKDKMLWGCHPYGAYYVADYQPGAYVILKRNKGYKTNNPLVDNKGACHIKKIKIVFSGEDFTLAKGVQSGAYDVLSSTPTDYYSKLKKNSDVKVVDAAGSTIDYGEFNMKNELFADKNVRKALILGINRDHMKSYLSKADDPAYCFVLNKSLNYSKDASKYYKDNYSYNKKEAKKLLAAAGWKKNDKGILEKNGKTFTFTMKTSDSDNVKKSIQALQADWKDLGVNMKIEAKDWSYVNQDVEKGKFACARLGLGWSEPFLLFDIFMSRSSTETACTNPDPSGYAALVAKARATVDYDKRTEVVTQIQEKLMDYCTIFPIMSEGGTRCWRSEIKGIKYTPTGGFWVNDVKVDKDGSFRNVE